MAIISAEVEVLDAKGKELAAAATRLRGEIANVRTSCDPAEIFNGDAATKYAQVYGEWDAAQNTMLNSLEELGQWLSSAAESIRTHDQALKDSLGFA